MSKVYVVNEPMKRGPSGEFVPMFDLSGASQYGELVSLLPPGQMPNDLRYVRETIGDRLTDVSADDWLLLIGNPVAIAIAAALAADMTDGKLKFLRWHSQNHAYQPMSVDLWPND